MTGNADAETVRSYYEYVDATDVESLLDLFAPDVTYDRPGQASIEGRDELRAFYETGRPLEDGRIAYRASYTDRDTV